MVAMLKGTQENIFVGTNASEQLNRPEEKQTTARNFSFKGQNLRLSEIESHSENTKKIIYDDNTMYIGETNGNMKHGRGTLLSPNGDKIEGQFVDDRIQGHATFTGVDGTTYEGEWKDDIQHGYGKETWADGSSYTGYQREGVKHGQGEYYWADGSSYNGNWIAGDIEGYVR